MKRPYLTGVLLGTIVFCLITLAMMAEVQSKYANRIQAPPTSSSSTTAIILGAGVFKNGTPTDALRDRLDTGIQLYNEHAVNQLLLTGDDGAYHADEIDVMQRYILEHNVPTSTLIFDGKGYRTYESCKHAKELGLSSVIVVTQRFHLSRALYLCNKLGLNAVGASADRHTYRSISYFWLRDLAASVEAWWDINIQAPAPPV